MRKRIIVLVVLLFAVMFALPTGALSLPPPSFATPNFVYALVHVDETPVLFINFDSETNGIFAQTVFTLYNGEVRQLQPTHTYDDEAYAWQWDMRIDSIARWGTERHSFGNSQWDPWFYISIDTENFAYTITEYRPQRIRAAFAYGMPDEDVIYRLLTDPDFVPEEPEIIEFSSFPQRSAFWRMIDFLLWERLLITIALGGFVLGAVITSLIFALIIRKRRKHHAPKS